MEPTIEQQVAARLAELPPDVRNAIQSADLTRTMQAIGTSHQLHLDQLTALEQEVMLVMLGFADPDDFASSVIEEVHVPADVANEITKEVSEKVFSPIRESMKAFIDKRATEPETTAQSDIQPGMKSSAPSTPTTTIVPAPTAPAVTTSAPAAEEKPSFPAADVMLSQKTVTKPETPPASQPRPYSADPYREPIEP